MSSDRQRGSNELKQIQCRMSSDREAGELRVAIDREAVMSSERQRGSKEL